MLEERRRSKMENCCEIAPVRQRIKLGSQGLWKQMSESDREDEGEEDAH